MTRHGEMFSCERMAALASGIEGMEACVARDILTSPARLLEALARGDLLLAPYPLGQEAWLHGETLNNISSNIIMIYLTPTRHAHYR